MGSPFQAQELKDGLLMFDKGMNHGAAPETVPRNQMFDAVNVSVRGEFARHRPYFKKRALNLINTALKPIIDVGWFQGSCYYKPDLGPECLMASISGRLYRCEIQAGQAVVTDVTGAVPQLANATQCWLWQAEKWVIWNDGSSNPVFYTDNPIPPGVSIVRSNYGTPTNYSGKNTAAFLVPDVGDEVTVAFAVTLPGVIGDVHVGDIMTVTNRGTFSVQDIAGANVTFLNVNATPSGYNVTVPATDNFTWSRNGAQLPPGRMGTYGMGRIWMALPDGKQFVAGDCVGGSSGSKTDNFRDAILYITENLYLAGGGNFSVPGSYGEIQALRFAAVLDASLGQGPLQVFTPTSVFSCQTPTDRLTWQDVTNPILTESLIAGGGLGQNSTIAANGDTIMRSVEGMRSLILARREFSTWGNTPISHEVEPIFDFDSQDLLPWTSAAIFDNRLLMTTGSVLGEHGPYFRGLVPLNFDPVSSLVEKKPSVYDSRVWEGLNVYQILVGRFAKVTRCFAFTWNAVSDELELYELEKEEPSTEVADNGITRVAWVIESGTLDFGESDPRLRHYKRLLNGELWVDDLKGKVDFFVYYKPDQWPCWVPWIKFQECATKVAYGNNKPQFRPRLGLGEPSGQFFDTVTNRPLREAYTFRVKIEIVGHCTFKGAQFACTTIPEPRYAPPVCAAICP